MKFVYTDKERIKLDCGTIWHEFQKGSFVDNEHVYWKSDSIYIWDDDLDEQGLCAFFYEHVPNYSKYEQIEVSKELWYNCYYESKKENTFVKDIFESLHKWAEKVFETEKYITITGI